jgi:hypothetical protein
MSNKIVERVTIRKTYDGFIASTEKRQDATHENHHGFGKTIGAALTALGEYLEQLGDYKNIDNQEDINRGR